MLISPTISLTTSSTCRSSSAWSMQVACTTAARSLPMYLAVMSSKLYRLEVRLGVQLINRTTRTLALTEEGCRFPRPLLPHSRRKSKPERRSRRAAKCRRGVCLGYTSTFALGRQAPGLAPADSQDHYIRTAGWHLEASDSFVNLVDGGSDLAIRFQHCPNCGLIARPLATKRLRHMCIRRLSRPTGTPKNDRRRPTPQIPTSIARP